MKEVYQGKCQYYLGVRIVSKNKKTKNNSLGDILAKPFDLIGGLFKSLYDSYTDALKVIEDERERIRKKEEKEREANIKFFHALEHTEIHLEDALDASKGDIEKFESSEAYHKYLPTYDKKMKEFIEKNKKKLEGDELRIYLLLCRRNFITVKDAQKYLNCDYNHAFNLLESMCNRLYISKNKYSNKNYYVLFDSRWLHEL